MERGTETAKTLTMTHKMRDFDKEWVQHGSSWSNIYDVKLLAKEVWLVSAKNEQRACIKLIKGFFHCGIPFLDSISKGLVDHIRNYRNE